MRDELIAEVSIDLDDRLLVRPAGTVFDGIYRAALGVNWDRGQNALVSPVPREWDHAQWFTQILAAAADEYGVALKVDAATKWSGVPSQLRRQMEAYAQSDWLQKFTAARQQTDEGGWRRLELAYAMSDAAACWEAGCYADYVRTLAPYRDLLSPAQLKRLAIAERRMGS